MTCPMGRQLFRKKDTRYGTVYSSREACRTCPNRCTDFRGSRSTSTSADNSVYVPVVMYGDPRFPLQQIPDVTQHSPHNNFGRLKRAEKRVMVFIRRDIRKQKLRQQTSEHPFGTIKHYDDGRHFLCQGQGKGHRRIRPLGAELQHPKSHRPLRRRSETHRTLPQDSYAQNPKNRGNLRGKPLFFSRFRALDG